MLRGFFLLWVCLHIVQMTGDFLFIAQKEALSVSCSIMVTSRDPSLRHSVTLKENYENIKVVLETLTLTLTKTEVLRSPVVDMCGFKNGEFPIRATRRS